MIIDSEFGSLEATLSGLDIPFDVRKTLALVNVSYISFDHNEHQGQLVVHQELANEVNVIFSELLKIRFPILKAVPIIAYGWDDEASMEDNNTSAFNYRRVIGTDRLSNHSFGRAIDINPLLNPYHARGGKVYPCGATYDPGQPGTLDAHSPAVAIFKGHGWDWLGDREQYTDYQHFQKP